MSDYRRNFRPGGTFFFTVVTHQRQPLLCQPIARRLLHRFIRDERQRRPFIIDAAVLLPDHLHMIWTLPQGDGDFAIRWAAIKGDFSRMWLAGGGSERHIAVSSHREERRGVWQRRFIEHTIRDEQDFARHADYIHYNPVKHGLVDSPVQWRCSSFHRYVRIGVYPKHWGLAHPRQLEELALPVME